MAYSRTATFSLPAESPASSVLCRFIRQMAVVTGLSTDQIADFELAATEAFDRAVSHGCGDSQGRVALKIDAGVDGITVDIVYRETRFPPEEFFSRS